MAKLLILFVLGILGAFVVIGGVVYMAHMSEEWIKDQRGNK
jgi:hypothetical protein